MNIIRGTTVVFLILFLVNSSILYSQDDRSEFYLQDNIPREEDADKQGEKAVHGIINLMTSPIEIPMQAYKGKKRGMAGFEKNPALSRFSGGVWGLVGRGPYKALGRAWLGIYQLTGFWGMNPKDNKGFGMPLDSEYAFELTEPKILSFREGTKAIFRKFCRGGMNIIWGFVEGPKRSYHGIKEGHPFRGMNQGKWYAGSRLWYGMYEMGGFLLPGYEETEGYTFEVDEPWKKKKSDDSITSFSLP